MDKLKKKRELKRREFNKIHAFIAEEMSKDTPDVQLIQVKFVILEKIYSVITSLNNDIEDKLIESDASEYDLEAEEIMITEFEEKFELLKLKSSTSLVTTSVNGNSTNQTFKLPQLELRKFNGELSDWLPFWSQFKKIDEDKSLHAADKFHYLRQSMTPNTEAYEILFSYPETAENYPKVVAALQNRYGNEDLLLQVYIRELLKIIIDVHKREKYTLEMLHIKLDAQLRALQSLNLNKADPVSWIFPLVESSLPEDILLQWQRSPLAIKDGSKLNPPVNKLDYLMEFLDREVKIRQRMNLAKSGFSNVILNEEGKKKKGFSKKDEVSTLANFHVSENNRCVFCGKPHRSQDCFKLMKWTWEEKRKFLQDNNLCYVCFRHCNSKHNAKTCKLNIKCIVCDRKHHTIMCPDVKKSCPSNKRETEMQNEREEINKSEVGHSQALEFGMAGHYSNEVILQTIMVVLRNGDKEKLVRALFDSGCQRSYILEKTAVKLELKSYGTERVKLSLFGGEKTEIRQQCKYQLEVQRPNGEYRYRMEVRSSPKICNDISRINKSTIEISKLKENKVYITDVGTDCPEIELLIGADYYGTFLTGKIVQLNPKMTALETKLGWTISGEQLNSNNIVNEDFTMSVKEEHVHKLWDFEIIGIRDPVEVKTEEELAIAAKKRLLHTISRNVDGRYRVCLPWKENRWLLPVNKEICIKRLNRAVFTLEKSNLVKSYDKIFKEWEQEGFIEKVPPSNVNNKEVHYLPHRPVLKDSETTPIRPVFDASCHSGKNPSLNDCLEKGGNYVKSIPQILLRFREKEVGFVSDIRKAFQMIEVENNDRDFMRFLWYDEGNKNNLIEYRHCRVMFGANCSPFILGAVVEHHLRNVPDEDKKIGQILLESFYVDIVFLQ